MKAAETNPTARTIRDLLQVKEITGSRKTISDCDSGISPSVARFINSAAPFAIHSGIGRAVAATVTNDYSIVPSAKFYYSMVKRSEIWAASETMFSALGWGKPVDFVDGLAVGSCVVPTNEAISKLYKWMVEQVNRTRPGKRYTLQSLIQHHNEYAFLCATITLLCLASRKQKITNFTAKHLDERCAFIPVYDKPAGLNTGFLSIPINEILRKLILFWRAHCNALKKRLDKLGIATSSNLRIRLQNIHIRTSVNMFFLINENLPVDFGTADLSRWWPDELKLSTYFGRDFWEVELMEYRVSSSSIDLFLRHHLQGMENWTSTTNIVLANWGREICDVQEAILDALGISAVVGLSSK